MIGKEDTYALDELDRKLAERLGWTLCGYDSFGNRGEGDPEIAYALGDGDPNGFICRLLAYCEGCVRRFEGGYHDNKCEAWMEQFSPEVWRPTRDANQVLLALELSHLDHEILATWCGLNWWKVVYRVDNRAYRSGPHLFSESLARLLLDVTVKEREELGDR